MTIKKKTTLAAVLIVFGTLAALFLLSPATIPEEPLPNPNGCDDFVKARLLISSDFPDWNTLSVEKLRELVATNEPVLQLIRTGLTKECRVAPYVLTDVTNNHMTDLASSKRTAHAFCATIRLALLDGRTNDAAILSLDCIRYGQESARGGVIIDGLVSIAIQAIGRARLEEALPGIDTATSRSVVSTLDDVVGKQEPCADVFKREKQWARLGRFGSYGIVARLIQPFLQRGMRAKTEQKFTKSLNDLQRTKLRAAAHAYELDHGKPPASARDLVPQYLKSIPLDPATDQELPLD